MSVEIKAVVSVAEMARMVGLSRARFYQLIGSAFPHPVYSVSTRRPFYDDEMQKLCLEVRRRNCGINGTPILFYCRSSSVRPVTKRPIRTKINGHAELINGLKSLGLSVTPAQVDSAVTILYPRGIDGVELGQVIRTVFVHLKNNASEFVR